MPIISYSRTGQDQENAEYHERRLATLLDLNVRKNNWINKLKDGCLCPTDTVQEMLRSDQGKTGMELGLDAEAEMDSEPQ